MARTTRADLDALCERLAILTGDPTLRVERYQPGDSRTPFKIVGGTSGGAEPFGARRRSAGELADAMRFAIRTIALMGGERFDYMACADGACLTKDDAALGLSSAIVRARQLVASEAHDVVSIVFPLP